MTSALILAVTTLRSSFKCVCIFFGYRFCFLLACFVNKSLKVSFQIALIFLSPESGQDHDVNTANRAFEDVAKFIVLAIAEHIKILYF
jgi:hypothetical protein